MKIKNLRLVLFLSFLFGNIHAQTCNVTLRVNMKYAIEQGKLNPQSDYVDVAGSFNGWDGTNHHLTAGDDSVYSITLSNLLIDSIFEYKFRINGSWDDNLHEFPAGGSNRKFRTPHTGDLVVSKIFNNNKPGCVPVVIKVNMSVWADNGKFNPQIDFVDVAGTFNNWPEPSSDQLLDVEDMIYSGTVLAQVGEISFKCRINGSWDDSKHEFSGGGPNRNFVVQDTAGGVSNVFGPFYFNDDTTIVNSVNLALVNEISVFPNPASDIVVIKSNNNIQRIIVNDINGRQVTVIKGNSSNLQSIDLSSYSSGVYFVTVFDNYAGNSIQIIKK